MREIRQFYYVVVRDRYVFLVCPMLCPDGVEAGHTLCDMGGCDLSTRYDTPDDRMESGVAAWKKQLEALGDDLTMWIDIKTRQGGKGLTMWGCLPLLEASSSNK
jgi:hypothetical protein